MKQESDLAGIKEAAEILEVGESTLSEWCRKGLVPGAEKIGNSWVLKKSRLNEIKIPKMGRPTKNEDQENV